MDIARAYNMEQDRIEESDMTDEEKLQARMDLDDDMRRHEEERQDELDDVNRRYGH